MHARTHTHIRAGMHRCARNMCTKLHTHVCLDSFTAGSCPDFAVRLTSYPKGHVELFLVSGGVADPATKKLAAAGWHPLCGPGGGDFESNDGAVTICRKLGYDSGVVVPTAPTALLSSTDLGKTFEVRKDGRKLRTYVNGVRRTVKWGKIKPPPFQGKIKSVDSKRNGVVKLEDGTELKNPGVDWYGFNRDFGTMLKRNAFQIRKCGPGQWGLKNRCNAGENLYTLNSPACRAGR